MADQVLAAAIGMAGTVLVGFLSLLGLRFSSRSNERTAAHQRELELVSKWREYAEGFEERSERQDAKIANLEIALAAERRESQQDRADLRAQMACMGERLGISLAHIIEMWQWIEAGAKPPPPGRPRNVVELIETMSQDSRAHW